VWRYAARWMASVVFPTPPLAFPTPIIIGVPYRTGLPIWIYINLHNYKFEQPEIQDGNFDWWRTRCLRTMCRDFFQASWVVSISVSASLETGSQDFIPPLWPTSEHTSTAQRHARQVPLWFRPSVAGPRRNPKEQHVFQAPYVIGHSSSHRRCTGLPQLGWAPPIGGLGDPQTPTR